MIPTDEMVRAARGVYNHRRHSSINQMIEEMLSAALAAMWQDHVIVPREASEEIVNAALDSHARITPSESPFGPDGYFSQIYKAMVSAPTQLSTRGAEDDSAKIAQSEHPPSTRESY